VPWYKIILRADAVGKRETTKRFLRILTERAACRRLASLWMHNKDVSANEAWCYLVTEDLPSFQSLIDETGTQEYPACLVWVSPS